MLVILIGESASGKDTIAKKLVRDGEFIPLIGTTTRPMREGEVNGVDYEFIDKETFGKRIMEDSFIEYRKYDTINNGQKDVWFYGTPKANLNPNENYIKIVDVDGAKSLINHYGRENCFVAYVYADSITRQHRSMERGSFESSEWLRRLDDDAVKFSPARVGEVTNYIALNNDNNLENTVYYLTTAICSYSMKNRLKDEKYICSLYENDNGELRVRVVNEKDSDREISYRLERLDKINKEIRLEK